MKDLVKKVAVGFSTAALLANMTALPAFGAFEVVVTGNGSYSENEVDVDQENTTVVEQSNEAKIENNISANADSGNNSADDNTGGDVNIDTGNVQTAVEVSNAVNSNEASVDCSSCPTDVKALISGNGSKSDNKVDLDLTNETFVDQYNKAHVDNDVYAKANSGYNDADDTTGGDVSIDTGSALSFVDIENQANANVAHVGNGAGGQGWLELVVTGNGADSDNDMYVDLANSVVLEQDNWAGIYNDVEVDANTGKNDADDSTGGVVSIDTGAAAAGALVDNMANFNLAHIEDCCEFDGLLKIAGNGADSDSKVDFDFETFLGNVQDNGYKQYNDVDADANSGKNDVDDSTGSVYGDPSIDTGSASTEVEVASTGNSNVFSTGDGLSDSDWWGDWSESSNGMWAWLVGHVNVSH